MLMEKNSNTIKLPKSFEQFYQIKTFEELDNRLFKLSTDLYNLLELCHKEQIDETALKKTYTFINKYIDHYQ
jgi:hypothetical protein